MRSKRHYRLWSLVLLVGVLLAAGPSVFAQEFVGVKGRITDTEGRPLVGHRAVFRPVEGDETFVSGISDASGAYVISLPLGGEFVPVALVTSAGDRIELSPDEVPLTVRKGSGRNIRLPPGTEQAPDNVGDRARNVLVAGKITDVDGDPLAGYRIVFRQGNDVFLSNPSLANGEYTITLPEQQSFSPLAACSSNGLRFPLDEAPLQPRANTRRDFSVPVRSPSVFEPAFAGADRLFLSFAEDPATTGFVHEQAQVEIARIDSREVLVSRLILATQLPGLTNTEMGLRVGFGGYDAASGPDLTGMTDLDLWAKLNLGSAVDGTEYAAGFVSTVPTGKVAPGLGDDAWSTKLFASGRRTIGRGVLSGNLGLRISGDAMILGLRHDGRLSGSAAMGWLTPVHPNVNLILEAAVESQRYAGVDAEFRLLGGFNISVHDVSIRLALAGGLTDSTPDYQFLGGVAIEF